MTPGQTAAERRAAAQRAVRLADEALLAECTEEFHTARGPGGQHRNKAATAVRLVHGPTGIAVTATERRSQARNRAAALERLRLRLAALSVVPKVRRPTRATAASRERRLADKRRRGVRKADRRALDD